MTKLLKILRFFAFNLLELVLILLISLFLGIQLIPVQNYFAKIGTNFLEKNYNVKVNIDRIQINFFDRLHLRGVYIEDHHNDTLLFTQNLAVNLNFESLKKGELVLDFVKIKGGKFNLIHYENEENSNLIRWINNFKSDTPSSSSDFMLYIDKISLENNQVLIDNQNISKTDFGIDYAHLKISKLNALFEQVSLSNDTYSADISFIKFKEQSGFVLNSLTSSARFSEKGLQMSELEINTPFTNLEIPYFNLITNNLSDFSDFIDSVHFDAKINDSEVSLIDVSYFAPALKGMEQSVDLASNIGASISSLQLFDLSLKYANNTQISGDFILPDFRDLNNQKLENRIENIFLDFKEINGFNLPSKDGENKLFLPTEVMRMQYVTARNVVFTGGFNEFNVFLNQLNTGTGSIDFNSPINISNSDLNGGTLSVKKVNNESRFVKFNDFELNKILNNNDLGKVNGTIDFELVYTKDKAFNINNIKGNIRKFKLFGYKYDQLYIPSVDLSLGMGKNKDFSIDGALHVRDDQMDFSYKGKTTIGEKITMGAHIDLYCANLPYVHPSLDNRGEIKATLDIDGSGSSIDDFIGQIELNDLYYEENGQEIKLNHLYGLVEKTNIEDRLVINSDVLDVNLNGIVKMDLVLDNIIYQASQVFPALLSDIEPVFDADSKFDFYFDIKSVNSIFNIFYPEINIANNTIIDGQYDGKNNLFDLNIDTDYFIYNNLELRNISLFQELINGQLLALYRADEVIFNDSLVSQEVHFTNLAMNGLMDSHLIFHDKFNLRSNIEWNTYIFESDGFDIDFMASYVSLNKQKWELPEKAHVNFSQDCFLIEDFRLTHNKQLVEVNGQISKVPTDKLNIEIRGFNIQDVSVFFLPENEIYGTVNFSGQISEIFTAVKFNGITNVFDLIIDEREIGDLGFSADYNNQNKKLDMMGDLFFKQQNTFKFSGAYDFESEDSPIDLKLDFNGTDIGFINSFLDEDVASGIQGQLKGAFAVSGSIKEPLIEGEIDLENGKATLALLGANFAYEGKVKSSDYGITFDNMPISDEDGNTGSLNGQILHKNFSDYYYEINFDFENDPRYSNPLNPSERRKIDRFKVMNTSYTEESIYYGAAYMTGFASIFGTPDNMTIDVSAKTKRGTRINFPMYGPKTISEEGFISFKKPGDLDQDTIEKGIDFTNVNLQLDFNITPDARVKLIFDDDLGDEITAYGNANLKMTLDNYGDVALNGTYTVTEGVYNFAMGPYRQLFNISPGGSVVWTGDPLSAILDIETFYKTNANLSVVMPDVVENRSSDNEEIYSYLRLKGEMYKPQISFDIDAPRATEAGKAVINRIRSDRDELNRQFFSILILKRFVPLTGQGLGRGSAGSNNAALDLVSTQINSVLSKMSDEYKMNVNLESDDLSGESSVEFGVSKGFLDDRLQVRGSFGVGSYTQSQGTQNNLIGDLFIEYLLNEKGTFRVNAFNESNANSVVLNTNRGYFTQGVGVNYQEDFYNVNDFKLVQFILDWFRKDKRLDYNNDSRYKTIPPEAIEEHKKNQK